MLLTRNKAAAAVITDYLVVKKKSVVEWQLINQCRKKEVINKQRIIFAE